MRIAKSATLAACLSTLVAAQARADWQYTKWGMSLADVTEAANEQAVPVKDPDKNSDLAEVLLSAPYKTDRFRFRAYFGFAIENGLLNTVNLELEKPADCSILLYYLRSRYGIPMREQSPTKIMHQITWRDVDNTNLITFLQISVGASEVKSCSLKYEEIVDQSSGL